MTLLNGENGGILPCAITHHPIYNEVNECLKTLYGEFAEVKLDDDANINKSVRYVISLPKAITNQIMFDCGIAKFSLNNEFTLIQGIDEHIIENECCAKSYIRGVFATASTTPSSPFF